jgi:hypothetical protein
LGSTEPARILLPPQLSFVPDHLFATKERKDHKEGSFVFLPPFTIKSLRVVQKRTDGSAPALTQAATTMPTSSDTIFHEQSQTNPH